MEAKELFHICRELAAEGPSATAWRRLHELLVLTAAEGCRHAGGTFGGLFAQVDWLCKTLGLAVRERREVQTLRRHTNGGGEDVAVCEWPYDLRAMALLISAVFGEDVPGPLRQLLPPQPREHEKGVRIDRRYIRCIVQSWDDRHIRATTEDSDIVIDYATEREGRDFGYLRRLLREHLQLNLLDCGLTDGVVIPGMVVVEPDFLVDISSVAACFTNYGHHPLLYTVNRMKSKANSQAVLLGNFAGTALDDLIHQPLPHPSSSNTSDTALRSTLRKSFQEQALRFCACEPFDAAQFKTDAATQVKNIGEAVDVLFGYQHFDRHLALLEPSFVCEQLGLQGRADLMTSDLRLLVEQKSGRNPKIERQSHDSHGKQLESHYVQLLLYYGILRYNFGRSDQQVDIRLLYSRYPAAEGLMSVSYLQQLFREALRLRNQIVATEMLIAREGFGRILPLLSSAVIYKDAAKDRIFHEYVEPQLQALLAPLGSLNALERAYYEQMMTFVYREQLCQKLGNGETRLQHSGGAASDLWLMPIEEKKETGNIFAGLTVKSLERSSDAGGFNMVTLSARPGGQENFRRGDMVYLYAYAERPDVRESILYKGTLEKIGTDSLTVRLNNGQQNDRLPAGKGKLWAVEHAGSDVGTSAQIRSLLQFASATPRRRALLLGQRTPEHDPTLRLSRSHHPNYDDMVLRALQARDYFLLVGPPGTGKTSMALRFLVEEMVLAAPHAAQSILLTAYTNRAVDEICGMLQEAGADYLRLGNEAACDERFRDHLLEQALEHTARLDEMKRKIEQVPVIVATTSTLLSRQEIFQLKHFACCIVDEASQILEPSVIGLLSSDRIDRFILIGDHKQLPAVVQQSEEDAHVEEPLLRDICIDNCRQSLFERLLRWEQRQGRQQFVGTLNHQGRMHPDVACFPATAFYAKERLGVVPLPHQQAQSLGYDLPAQDRVDEVLKSQRVVFFHQETTHQAGSDQANLGEARLVADLLRRIHRFYGPRFVAGKTVGVIVPYRNQIAAIRQEMAQLGIPELADVSIDTVERYQGSQRDVIIYSFTVSRRYQLDFLAANTFVEDGRLIDRKLNVALTRARCQMLITGCADLLRHNPLFRQLIEQYSFR